MATKIDSSGYAYKGWGVGNTSGVWSYNGSLYYVTGRHETEEIVYVQVWVYNGSTWTGYTGPAIGDTGASTAYAYSSIAADVLGGTMWIAYQGKTSGGIPLPYIVRFDMDALTFGTPITSYNDTPPHGAYNAFHSEDGITFTADVPSWNFIYATGTTSFTLFTHGTLGGFLHLNIARSEYEAGVWVSQSVVGRNSLTLSDMMVANLRDGMNRHIWFVSPAGVLYHQQIGGAVNTVATDVKVITGTDDIGHVNLTGVAIGKPWFTGFDIYLPYKSSSNTMKLAKYVSSTWSTETVDSSKVPYSHLFTSTPGSQVESDCGNIAAAYVLSGVPEVLFWDNANNLNQADGSPAATTQTLWRSRYVSGAWAAPTAAVASAAWQRDIDVVVVGTTAHVIFQRFDASTWLTPWHEQITAPGGTGTITVPSIAATSVFGSFSGIRGGVPSGEGCGSGPGLPSSAGTIYPGCSTYTAL